MKYSLVFGFFLSIMMMACSSGAPTAPETGVTEPTQTQGRSAHYEGPQVALLSLEHEVSSFSVTVTGRIENIADERITDLKVRIALFDSTGIKLTTETTYPDAGGVLSDPLPVGGQTYFDDIYLGTAVDTSRTTVEFSIDGVIVEYDDRTRTTTTPVQTDTLQLYERYDFRWSHWNDSFEKVVDTEPGLLLFLDGDGGAEGRQETWATEDIFHFEDSVTDTVSVWYTFLARSLVVGWYYFDDLTANQMTYLTAQLDDRYGTSTTDSGGRKIWEKNDNTSVALTTTAPFFLIYTDEDLAIAFLDAVNYSEFPVRVTVPDR